MQELQVKVNEKLFNTSINSENSNQIKINDKLFDIKFLRDHKNNVKTYLVNDKVVTIQADENSDGNIKILYNNFEYINEIKTETRALLEKFMKTSSSGNKEGIIKSPMPGLVVKINCAVGDTIQKGDKIIIIEAMKMENALSCPKSGIIKSIKVAEGQAVEKNTVLIEVE